MKKLFAILLLCLFSITWEASVSALENGSQAGNGAGNPAGNTSVDENVDKSLNDGTVVFINGSMGKLYGLLQLPDLPPDGKCHMVIMCHGFRGNLNYHLWKPLARILNAHGIGVLRFDFNGCGKSEGLFEDMTVPGEIDDLMSVISWTRSLPSTDGISMVGHSQGGVVCGMAAGECGAPQIRALCLLSAAAVLRDDALRGNTMGVRYDPWHLDKPFYTLPGGERLGRAYIRTAMNLPIYETTSAYGGPVLIVNGMADQVVPYTYAQRYRQVLPQASLVIIPGEDHGLTINPDYVTSLVATWIVNTISK